LIGDEEEATRWSKRFIEDASENTERELDKDMNSSLSTASNVDKVLTY